VAGSYSILYPAPNKRSVININAYGVNSAGGYGSDLAFSTTNDTMLSERMRLTATGQVGIGTTNPLYALDVNGDVNIATGSHFKINGVNLSYSDIGAQQAYTNLSTIGALANSSGWLYNNGTGTFSYSTPTGLISGLTSGYLPYATSGTALGNSALYYTGTNVGIGTTNPLVNWTLPEEIFAWRMGKVWNGAEQKTTSPDQTRAIIWR